MSAEHRDLARLAYKKNAKYSSHVYSSVTDSVLLKCLIVTDTM